MSISPKIHTVAEFEAYLAAHPDGLFELINGEIFEKVPTEEHAHIAGIIAGELHLYLKQHPDLKARFGVEARFRPEEDDFNDRMPDVFLRFTDEPRVTQGPVSGLPDVAIEIKSPDDTYRGLRAKAAFYMEHAVKMVWLVFPDKQIVEVYEQERDIRILQPGDTILGGEILPDFGLPVDDLFDE